MNARQAATLFLCAIASGSALGQESQPGNPNPQPPRPPRVQYGPANPPADREGMWPAPTAEDWRKPCLLTFQRTWEDAVAVAKESGRPILVCINMDGEIASEHYAGVRYRSPEIAPLYEPYVLVIASVYRHTPRDHDDQGRRILCPRFGSVTCGEHIDIEPGIFEKFCDGQRVAPRHICVELDGSESYDVYYANDTASVFQAIREGIEKRPPLPPPIVRGDRPVLERVASRDVRDRAAVEAAFAGGSPEERKSLLEAATNHPDVAQVDLLRLAIFGLDPDRSREARKALAGLETPDAARLVSDAMRVPMEAAEREALLKALQTMGTKSPLARWLSTVQQGLLGRSTSVDPQTWWEAASRREQQATSPWHDGAGLAVHMEERAQASKATQESPDAHLDLAEISLLLAVQEPDGFGDPRRARFFRRHMLESALSEIAAAERLGAKGWRADSVAALALYHDGKEAEAYPRAEAAVKAIPAGDASWASMAVVTVFAESRWKAIKAAVREEKPWQSQWLADLHAAYSLLLRHPLGTDGQVAWHYDFLAWLGADHRAQRVLDEGLGRFAESTALHERLRDRILKESGPDGLEAYYAKMLEERKEGGRVGALAGGASVVAAEHHRRMGRFEEALDCYGRAISYYESAIAGDPAEREAADRAIALVHAARARVLLELKQEGKALEAMLASFARSPSSAGTRDGMGIKPGETAQMLLSRLRAGGGEEEAKRLEEALASLDPALLVPDGE